MRYSTVRETDLNSSDAKFTGSLQVNTEVIEEDSFSRLNVQRSQYMLVDTSLRFTHPHLARLHDLDTHTQ